jgi:hypothetical protein
MSWLDISATLLTSGVLMLLAGICLAVAATL